ncbi:MAG TPA: helix-turn-helix domain-containing protein [Candidatus Saccharimonadales bacterium]|nr:helix-turn-helix domain-containing protein [Candidatus Saccharimonadales bacterium]
MTGFVTKKISRQRSLGANFKAARTKLEWTLEQAEVETKICAKYLQALEDGNYALLPAEAYNIGYVRGYARELKLDQEKSVQAYREERSREHFSPTAKPTLISPNRARNNHFFVTPKLIGAVVALVLFGGMVTYVALQLRAFSQPPMLVISNVPSELTSTKDTVALQGKTTAGAVVAINAEPILVAADGSFNQTISLAPGVNQITIKATSRAQQASQKTISVLYNQQGLASLPQSGTKE